MINNNKIFILKILYLFFLILKLYLSQLNIKHIGMLIIYFIKNLNQTFIKNKIKSF
jgi:hypothetical protein